ncbi:hypothetical protein HN873_012137 [Arachis hypogaea]
MDKGRDVAAAADLDEGGDAVAATVAERVMIEREELASPHNCQNLASYSTISAWPYVRFNHKGLQQYCQK